MGTEIPQPLYHQQTTMRLRAEPTASRYAIAGDQFWPEGVRAAQTPRARRTFRSAFRRDPVAAALFFVVLALSVGATRWYVGPLPVRTLASLLALGWLSVAHHKSTNRAVVACAPLIGLILASAALGVAVSLWNNSPPGDVLQQVLEVHAQAIVNLALAASLSLCLSRRFVLYAFIIVVLLGSAVAIAQSAGFNPAWDLRARLGVLQHDPIITARVYLRHERAMGISYSPIHLATQLCLAFAAFCLARSDRARDLSEKLIRGKPRRFDMRIVLAACVSLIICLASGNRSPMGGFVIFLVVYSGLKRPMLLVLTVPVALISLPILNEFINGLQAMGTRVSQLEDGSSAARVPLAVLGILEFLDRPLGYGLLFDSTEHVSKFWSQIADLSNANAAWSFATHNYYIVMLNKYGIFVLILAAWAARMCHRRRGDVLFFIPYAFHIGFHNDGPLLADFLIWFIIAPTPLPRVPHRLRGAMRVPVAVYARLPRTARLSGNARTPSAK